MRAFPPQPFKRYWDVLSSNTLCKQLSSLPAKRFGLSSPICLSMPPGSYLSIVGFITNDPAFVFLATTEHLTFSFPFPVSALIMIIDTIQINPNQHPPPPFGK